MTTATISRAAAGTECVPPGAGREAGGGARRPTTYNADDEQIFLELIGQRAEEENRQHFVTSLRRLEGQSAR